jgi:H+/Cl- antiporter ClcA
MSHQVVKRNKPSIILFALLFIGSTLTLFEKIYTHNFLWQMGLAVGSGLILGVVSSILLSNNTLKEIAKKGTSRDKTLFWYIGIIIGLVALVLIWIPTGPYMFVNSSYPPLSKQVSYMLLFFFYPAFVVAGLSAYVFNFWMWERKNKKVLYSNMKIIYPNPSITPPT